MFHAITAEPEQPRALDLFDRVVVLYLVLPLVIFVLGWLELWAAVPLVLCVVYALRPLVALTGAQRRESREAPRARRGTTDSSRLPVSRMQVTIACVVGCAWAVFGGTGHFVFANADWYIRDAVLHDLIVSPWPVGYGVVHGHEIILRAPLGYYMPAALVGKALGLWPGHLAMALWTAIGATLFLLQVLSLTPARKGAALTVAAVIVFFSGFDIIGSIISNPRFLDYWNIAQHLEWWAGLYQYSSMATQLFWVPNHALAAWLTIGLLCRVSRGPLLDAMLPMIVVAAALWSPLSALGLMPFVLLHLLRGVTRERMLSLLHPRVWGPAVVVGLVVSSYLVLDSSRMPFRSTWSGPQADAMDIAVDVTRQLQFFLLEAGLIGFVVLALRWSWEVVLALGVLLVLPGFYFGPGNDLVMRASIPSLAVLAIGVCLALNRESTRAVDSRKKLALVGMLAVGAVTPIQEFARAIVLPAWPIDMHSTLIVAACGQYPAHYTARLDGQFLGRLLRPPHRLELGPQRAFHECLNPATDLMLSRKIM
jgi:hypothetical protein